MSFIDTYLTKYKLDSLPQSVKETLNKVEQTLNDKANAITDGEAKFNECLKQYGPDIASVTERVSEKFKGISVKSVSDAISLLRFISSIGFEVYQIVDHLSACALPDSLSEESKKSAKIDFGVELTYFVWVTVSPLEGKLSWIPFKKTIERKVVRWLSKTSIQFAYDYFNRPPQSSSSYLRVI